VILLIIKSIAVGLLAAIGLLVLVVIALLLPSLWPLLRMWTSGSGVGAGGIGAVSYNPLAIAVVGFFLGFVWMFKRG
jgi:hypothetical protein